MSSGLDGEEENDDQVDEREDDAAGLSIAQAGLATGQEAATILIYVLLAGVTIRGPFVVYLAMGERASTGTASCVTQNTPRRSSESYRSGPNATNPRSSPIGPNPNSTR